MNVIAQPLKKNGACTADRISAALRTQILRGQYREGAPLRQDTIATELGVSKIPLREALVQLTSEGLVTFMPNRGFVVSAVSAAEVREIFAMRKALETLALEAAIPKLDMESLDQAQEILDAIDEEKDRAGWGDLNWQFHATLYQAASMPLLLNTIHTLHNNVVRYLIIYLDSLAASPVSQTQHREMLAACRRKNTRKAVQVLHRHLEQASQQLGSFLS